MLIMQVIFSDLNFIGIIDGNGVFLPIKFSVR